MAIADDFPDDPFTPSLRYAATCQVPITIPWTYEPIKLGASLLISRQSGEKSSFTQKTAFSDFSLKHSKLVFFSSAKGEMIEATTTSAGAAEEHVDFSCAASIGGSFLGASGQANYEKHVMSNESAIKSSVRTYYRNGKIMFNRTPQLSSHAELLLARKPTTIDPNQAFRDEYGEYFVAGYIIGGSNANMLGGAAAANTFRKDMSGSVTGKFLGFKKTKHFEDHEANSGSSALASLSAFDSLDNWQADSASLGDASYEGILSVAESNRKRGWGLAGRVVARTEQIGLRNGSEVAWEKCEAICQAGLVVELLLMPYAGLRDYAEAVLASCPR